MSLLLSRFVSDVCRLRSAELLVVQPQWQRQQQQQESGGDWLDTRQLLRRRRARFTASAAAASASSTQKSVSLYVSDLAARHQQRVRPTLETAISSPHAVCISLNVEMRLLTLLVMYIDVKWFMSFALELTRIFYHFTSTALQPAQSADWESFVSELLIESEIGCIDQEMGDFPKEKH